MNTPARAIQTAVRPVKALFVHDAAGGIVLIVAAFAAIVLANSALGPLYHHALLDPLWPAARFRLNTWHLWINDAVMAVFFFVVGLEVKYEVALGALSSADRRRLPVLAAVGGMAAPALVYTLIAGGEPVLMRGWAIPAATDIAFAMGVIGLLGSRVPPSLRLFLLTVAIVDDIGAVLIIALFYTSTIQLAWVAGALLVFGAMVGMNRFGVTRYTPFVIAAALLWLCVLYSGVHATIAGVVAALAIPLRTGDENSMAERMKHGLDPWNTFLVVPLFGFANAGVDVSGMGLAQLLAPLPLAIGAGLALGKQVGIFSCIALADRIGIAPRPEGASWPAIWGTSVLCGIGFTMSLFISELAFPRYRLLVEEAKIGILTGSLVSALLGYLVLRLATRTPRAARAPASTAGDRG